jgi:hypothetical protein
MSPSLNHARAISMQLQLKQLGWSGVTFALIGEQVINTRKARSTCHQQFRD